MKRTGPPAKSAKRKKTVESGLLVEKFQENLNAWFKENARDLPWRRTSDPYCIWVSEIMLQQTRVAAVIDRYNNFIERFPTLLTLALAKEDEVLAAWSGLGYYQRARMLQRAAVFILQEHSGSLPQTAERLVRLPGIGQYTAAAIASIAFAEPVAVVDGNVERVILRLLGLDVTAKPDIVRETATKLLDRQQPGHFNQAMMELGATICLPKSPLCDQCPVMEMCLTRGEHATKQRSKMRSSELTYALICRRENRRTEVLLEQRPFRASQMPGMWELPKVTVAPAAEERPLLSVRHSITNTNYYVNVYSIAPEELERLLPAEGTRVWTRAGSLAKVALTGLARKVLMRLDVIQQPKAEKPG